MNDEIDGKFQRRTVIIGVKKLFVPEFRSQTPLTTEIGILPFPTIDKHL